MRPKVITLKCRCAAEGKKPFTRGAYCLGKIVWGKGWEELIALLSQHSEARRQVLSGPLDAYGTGEAASEVSCSLCIVTSVDVNLCELNVSSVGETAAQAAKQS